MLNKWLLRLGVYLLKRVTFKKWSELEDKKYNCLQAVEDSNPDFPDLLVSYLSTALYFPINYSKVSWTDTLQAFFKVHSVTSVKRKIPLTSYHSNRKDKKDAWDYSGRLWYFYCNLIASTYGWSGKAIASLEIDDALAYIQEILTAQHLEHEFIWSTTTIAYPYDEVTKKSKFSAMTRPYWMTGKSEDTKPVRKAAPVPKSLLPVGNVIELYDPKKIKSGSDMETLPPTKTISG